MPASPEGSRAAGDSLISGGNVAGRALTLCLHNEDFSKNKMAQWAGTRSGLVARWFQRDHSRRNPALPGGKAHELESGGSQSVVP